VTGLPRGIQSFTAFWPIYLAEHRRAGCRVMHYGSALATLALVATAMLLGSPWPLLAVPATAYGLAWLGHFFIERNRPATWSYPWWSLRAEFRMAALAATGRLRPEMARLGIRPLR
jgi:hypothetical protein